MIKVLSYCVIVGKVRAWTVKFEGDNKPLNYRGDLCIGYKDENDKWVVFKVNSKSTELSPEGNRYIYSADFLGYYPDTNVDLEKVEFVWMDDEKAISNAHHQACLT